MQRVICIRDILTGGPGGALALAGWERSGEGKKVTSIIMAESGLSYRMHDSAAYDDGAGDVGLQMGKFSQIPYSEAVDMMRWLLSL